MSTPQMTMPHTGAPPVATPNIVAPSVAAPLVAPSGRGLTVNAAPSFTVGPGSAPRGGAVAGSLQSLVQGRNGAPILRNPAYANIAARDPASRAQVQSTFRGRFAQSDFVRDRHQHGRPFGRVIGFFGPVFWPYAYDDFLDYTFSPYAYDTFWPYAYDDVFNGIYGAPAPDSSDDGAIPDYALGPTTYVHGDQTGAWVAPAGPSSAAAPSTEGAAQICSAQAEGLTDFRIQRIAQQVKPNAEQQALLDDLTTVNAEAFNVLRATCPSDLPSTPTGRLGAMRSRVEAMLQAVRAIEPALQTFYQSLSDEQKERLNVIAADNPATAESPQPDPARLCGAGGQAAKLPIAEVGQMLRLSDELQTHLDALREASVKAGDILKANCPDEPTLTPTARLAHMKRRLEAMTQVLDAVQPALANFYGSLDDEQKAGFNRFGMRAP